MKRQSKELKKLFPRASKYSLEWVLRNEMGPNPLWFAELLSKHLNFKPGMKVLDLGCGTALSSIFLAKEFGVQVWATDLWISPDDNLLRIREANVENLVFPIQAEAHNLPFSTNFFDVIISINAYFYFGTDDLYLSYLTRFLQPNGYIGIAQCCFVKELEGASLPSYLSDWSLDVCHAMHSVDWWKRHFEKTGLMKVITAYHVKNGWKLWLEWERLREGKGLSRYPSDENALKKDSGNYLGLLVLVAQRTGSVTSLYNHRTWK